MHNIEFTEEVVFGEKAVTKIKVKPLTFVELVSLYDAIPAQQLNTKTFNRARINKQVTFYAGEETVKPTAMELHGLAYAVAKDIIAALDLNQGASGELVSKDADGIRDPIVYKLGTPIEVAVQGGQTNSKITELEFMAKTYGEMEDVLAAGTNYEQALALIEHVAVPLGENVNLQRLPGFALDKITSQDGLAITRLVMPVF